MTTKKDPAIKPWMEELWAWADKFELSEEELPRNINALLALTELTLTEKNITEVPKSIDNLKNLKILNLSENYELKAVPESIDNLIHLEELHLGYISLKKLPKNLINLINLINLKELNLDGNKLKVFPESIVDLVNLEELSLYDNALNKLPDSISQIKSLKILGLGSNKLKTLPESIVDLANLEYLILSHNALNTLPDSISQIKSLIGLNLDGNKLKTLPENIVDLVNLQQLSLYDNALNTLPNSITELKALEILLLYGNQLTDLSSKVIQFLEDLGLTVDDWKPDTDDSVVSQEPNYEMYLDEVPDNVSIDEVELDNAIIESIEKEVINVLDKIIKDNVTNFDQDRGYKVRPGYGYDKFYLDLVDGSYDMSLQSLVHYIMYEDGHYQKFLNKSQYARLLHVIQQYPESIFGLDHEFDANYEQIQHDLIDRIYYKSVRFVGITLIKSGFDVKSTFDEYIYDWDENSTGEDASE